MNEATVDRRVRKTKKQLRECLVDLLKEKKVQDITVREITDMADLNRGTFYLHYRDVFDLLEKTEQELLLDFNSLLHYYDASALKEHPGEVFLKIFSLAYDNAGLLKILLGENGDLTFVNQLKQLIREKCLEDRVNDFNIANTALFDVYFSFISSGYIGLVQYWLENGMKESPRELALLAEQITTQGIHLL